MYSNGSKGKQHELCYFYKLRRQKLLQMIENTAKLPIIVVMETINVGTYDMKLTEP